MTDKPNQNGSNSGSNPNSPPALHEGTDVTDSTNPLSPLSKDFEGKTLKNFDMRRNCLQRTLSSFKMTASVSSSSPFSRPSQYKPTIGGGSSQYRVERVK